MPTAQRGTTTDVGPIYSGTSSQSLQTAAQADTAWLLQRSYATCRIHDSCGCHIGSSGTNVHGVVALLYAVRGHLPCDNRLG